MYALQKLLVSLCNNLSVDRFTRKNWPRSNSRAQLTKYRYRIMNIPQIYFISCFVCCIITEKHENHTLNVQGVDKVI